MKEKETLGTIPEEGGAWKKQQREVVDDDLLNDLKKKQKGTF